MCGIVGLFSKSESIESHLGSYLSQMLIEMTERGPDSAGIAVYRTATDKNHTKLTVLSPEDNYNWKKVSDDLSQHYGGAVNFEIRGNQAHILFLVQKKVLRHGYIPTILTLS